MSLDQGVMQFFQLRRKIVFCRSNVEKVINCTGKDANSCGSTVRVSNFVGLVCEDLWSDCVGIAIISCKKDGKFGMSGL